MNCKTLGCAMLCWGGILAMPRAADFYVAAGGSNTDPYGSWASAAHSLQTAVAKACVAAGSGHTVYVTNGTYLLTGEVSVTKPIAIRSWNNGALDRDGTLIDGNYPAFSNRCFYISHDAGAALIEGFTITNGHCTVSGYAGGGGGVYMRSGTLRNCRITGCAVTNGNGGGVSADAKWYKGVLVTGCEVTGNTAYWTPGDGTGLGYGGGVFLATGATMTLSRVEGNVSLNKYLYGSGGGVWGGTLSHCRILGNTAAQGGGGVSCCVALRNCLVSGNTALSTSVDIGGGGVFLYSRDSASTIENSTIVNNTGMRAGGIYVFGSAKAYVTNSIVFHNQTSASEPVNTFKHPNYAGLLVCDHVCTTNPSATYVTFAGDGNLTNRAPDFANAAASDFRLSQRSPCINAGLNLAWMEGTTDLDGNPRLDRVNGLADLGCYEMPFQGLLLTIR